MRDTQLFMKGAAMRRRTCLTTTTRRLSPNALLLAVAGLVLAYPSRADIFHLNTGGEVEGKLISETDDAYIVLSVVGEFPLPKALVKEIEKKTSVVEIYEQRRDATPETAKGQYALARWCREEGMRRQWETHLHQAITLDPEYTPARRALGYVRVGRLWVDGRTIIERRDPEAVQRANEREAERLTRAIQGRWRRQIRAHRTNLMSGDPGKADRARAHLAAITDPLAIEPLLEVLSEGDQASRELLVDLLKVMAHEDAKMGLALIALLDPLQPVRERAMDVLKQRNDARLAGQFHLALRSPNDIIIERAAWAVGELGYKPAVPDLIPLLTAVRDKWVEVPVKDFLWYLSPYGDLAPAGNYGFTGAPINLWESYMGFAPTVIPWAGVYTPMSIHNEWRRRRIEVKRTQVLEALRKLTGQNLGFDADEWMRWYEQKVP
jgi:hypothetical protein